MYAKSLQLCLTFWTVRTVARLAPLSMGFSRQEYWHELPFPPPGELPDPRIEPVSPVALALQAESDCLSHQGSPFYYMKCNLNFKSNFDD